MIILFRPLPACAVMCACKDESTLNTRIHYSTVIRVPAIATSVRILAVTGTNRAHKLEILVLCVAK